MKKKSPITKERMIELIEDKLQDPNLSGREFTSLTKRLSNLQGWVKQGVYTRTPSQPEPEPPKSLPQQPLWVIRGELIESVANRLLNASEQVLTPEETEAALAVNFAPEELLVSAKNFIWNHAHPNELRELQESFVEDHPEIELPINTPGHWVSHLKAFPRITVNAGPTLTPDELEDVLQARAKAAMAREQVRRTLYERFPDRFLGGYKTVAEYDAAHPGASILRQLMVQPWLPEWLQQLHVRYPEMVHS